MAQETKAGIEAVSEILSQFEGKELETCVAYENRIALLFNNKDGTHYKVLWVEAVKYDDGEPGYLVQTSEL